MDISNIKYDIEVDGELISSVISLKDKCTSCLIKDALFINFEFSDDVLSVSVNNNSSTAMILSKLKLELFSERQYEEDYFIINPKKSSEKITYIPMSKINGNAKNESHLFEIFVQEENNIYNIFGFLGCQFSGNSIENIIKKNRLKISAVYNFINQELETGEKITLDSIYIKEGQNIFSLFNNFVDRMLMGYNTKETYNKKFTLIKSDTYSILFTYKVNSSTLKINDKPLWIKVDGKKLYAVNILKPEGKKKVFVNANAVLSRSNVLNLDGVGEYINIIEDNKLFNVYYELNKLLNSIKEHFEGVRFFSNDYPLGVLNENIVIDNKELILDDKRNLLSHLSGRKSNNHLNYDFFTKLLMQRIVAYNDKSFSASSPKVNELMSIVLGGGNIDSIKESQLLEMMEDIDTQYAIVPYIQSRKAFALLITGKKYMYITVFNLESEAVKFYCDLSIYSRYKELDGVAIEVYSDTNYLIEDGKLYIRKLKPMDCCLFKKPIESKRLATVEA